MQPLYPHKVSGENMAKVVISDKVTAANAETNANGAKNINAI